MTKESVRGKSFDFLPTIRDKDGEYRFMSDFICEKQKDKNFNQMIRRLIEKEYKSLKELETA